MELSRLYRSRLSVLWLVVAWAGGAWMAPGFTSEYVHFFLATELSPDALDPDEDEDLSPPIAMTEDELRAAIDSGELADAKTMVALTLLERYRART